MEWFFPSIFESLGGCDRNSFLPVLEAGSLTALCQRVRLWWEPSSGVRTADFSLYPLANPSNPIYEGLHPRDLIAPQKPNLQKPSHWRLDLQHMDFEGEGHKHLDLDNQYVCVYQGKPFSKFIIHLIMKCVFPFSVTELIRNRFYFISGLKKIMISLFWLHLMCCVKKLFFKEGRCLNDWESYSLKCWNKATKMLLAE